MKFNLSIWVLTLFYTEQYILIMTFDVTSTEHLLLTKENVGYFFHV
jgi:hypothetical protein